MAPSNAPRTGRGSFSSNGRHVRRSHDAGEDALFALSLDDVMSDRPWTADELTGANMRPADAAAARDAAERASQKAGHASGAHTAPARRETGAAHETAVAPTPRPASDPSETAAFLAAAAQRYVPGGATSHAAPVPEQPAPAALGVTAPMSMADQPTASVPAAQAMSAPAPAAAPSAAFETVAMPAMSEAAATQHAAAPETPEPASPEPPVMDLDDLSNRQFAFDSWAATDLDETSAGMPALDVPVNPLYSEPEPEPRIETEDYRRIEDFYRDSAFTSAPKRTTAAPVYAETPAGTYADAPEPEYDAADDDRFADYHTEEEPPRFSEFPQAAKVVFIAIVVSLIALIGFEGFQLFHGATEAESEVQQEEDANTDYLDLNTLKGDPNDGSSSE